MTFWKKPKFIVWTLALLLLAIVTLQNVEPTQVDFLFWSLPSMPKLVLILLSMIAGGVLALVAEREFGPRGRSKLH
jgi:uncharacterized integral membrane protein